MTLIQGPLVDPTWLVEHLDAGDVRVLETTAYLDPPASPGKAYELRSGRPEWAHGHIFGSAFADVITDLAEPHPTLNFTFPGPERFARGMQALGVGDDSAVVLYDRNGMSWSTRLWWLLRAYGFDNAGVLDGGWQNWAGPVSAAPAPARPEPSFTPRLRPELMATLDEVAEGPPCLLNALAPDVFSGETNRYGRAGRIPGSVNVFAKHLLDAHGRLLTSEKLVQQFGAADAIGGGRVITYCGAGVSATLDAFALTLLGEKDVAVYDGSMAEWISDPNRPLDRGPVIS